MCAATLRQLDCMLLRLELRPRMVVLITMSTSCFPSTLQILKSVGYFPTQTPHIAQSHFNPLVFVNTIK